MSTVKLKRNDVGRQFEDTLGIDITGCTIVFVMKNTQTEEVFRIDGEITNETAGRVKVTLLAEHAQVAATYNAEWEITFANSDVLTVPEGFYHTVEVMPDLAGESS